MHQYRNCDKASWHPADTTKKKELFAAQLKIALKTFQRVCELIICVQI